MLQISMRAGRPGSTNDALKESLAARLAATPRTVESLVLCAKIHMKLDRFEETYDEMPRPQESWAAHSKKCMIKLLPAAILYV